MQTHWKTNWKNRMAKRTYSPTLADVLSANIKKHCRRKGWTIYKLAKATSLHEQTVNQIASAKFDAPGVSKVQCIAIALGVTVDELIKGAKPQVPHKVDLKRNTWNTYEVMRSGRQRQVLKNPRIALWQTRVLDRDGEVVENPITISEEEGERLFAVSMRFAEKQGD